MGRATTPGILWRKGTWHIDKRVRGFGRLCESTGTSDLQEAEQFLARRLEEVRQARVYGVRPRRTFRDAATKYLDEWSHKRSIGRDAQELKILDRYIGQLSLNEVHLGTLDRFIRDRKASGTAAGTINRALAVVRRILNLAARLWRDEHGLTWLETAPLIPLQKNGDARKPYPLSWDEQAALFAELPEHLRQMALFKVNTGCREQEVCQLRWEWEVLIPELQSGVFVIPGGLAKNGQDRIIVLNRVARTVVESQRGKDAEFVFTLEGKPLTRMCNSGWKRARRTLAKKYAEKHGRPCPFGLAKVRVHDMKHTFGRRLRAAGVSFEDRQDLLGHKSARVTTHYSAAEVGSLMEAANRVCDDGSRKSPALTLIRAQATYVRQSVSA